MLDLRIATAAAALLVALVSVALAEPGKDQMQPTVQTPSDARPVRVILPALWETSNRPSEKPSSSK